MGVDMEDLMVTVLSFVLKGIFCLLPVVLFLCICKVAAGIIRGDYETKD